MQIMERADMDRQRRNRELDEWIQREFARDVQRERTYMQREIVERRRRLIEFGNINIGGR